MSAGKKSEKGKSEKNKAETPAIAAADTELSVRETQAARCREKISNAIRGASIAFYEMSMGLLEAYDNEYARVWGFDTFADYVERELDMKPRTAYYMVDIGRTVRQLGITADRVQKIGWTKMKEITGAMTAAPEDAEKFLNMAESMSTSQLRDALRSEVSLQGPVEGRPAVMRLSLKFEGDSAGIISDGLSLAYADIGKEDVNLGLAHIVGEWLMARGGGAQASTLEQWQEFMERTFGVKLVKAESEESLDAILVEAFTPEEDAAIDAELGEDDALAELLK